ncbi:DUF1127 domain-containing protein [Lutimaribacter marinistellae]|uniref:DUF1127 domain-containing protein n=1 Tax=Lutimaribacter marinistellae TaxID=1820329 RepID=A0ABV7TMH9_9RHOB
MANITTNNPASTGFLSGISGFFAAIGNGLVKIAENDSRVQRAQTLNALSDAELAQRGLKRDEIVAHVFRSSYYV